MNANHLILSVTSDPVVSDIIQTNLADYGYTVHNIENDYDLLHNDKINDYSCAILDSDNYPESAQTIDLARSLRIEQTTLPLIIIAGYKDIRDIVNETRKYYFDYLVKPFFVEQLVAILERQDRDRQAAFEKERIQETLRSYKNENEKLQTALREMIPDESRRQLKSFEGIGKSNTTDLRALRLYEKQKKQRLLLNDTKVSDPDNS